MLATPAPAIPFFFLFISTHIQFSPLFPILSYALLQQYLRSGVRGEPGRRGPQRAAMALLLAHASVAIPMAPTVAAMGPYAPAPRCLPSLGLLILRLLADG